MASKVGSKRGHLALACDGTLGDGTNVQLQHDWGQVETVLAGERCPVRFVVNTLGFQALPLYIVAPQAAGV